MGGGNLHEKIRHIEAPEAMADENIVLAAVVTVLRFKAIDGVGQQRYLVGAVSDKNRALIFRKLQARERDIMCAEKLLVGTIGIHVLVVILLRFVQIVRADFFFNRGLDFCSKKGIAIKKCFKILGAFFFTERHQLTEGVKVAPRQHDDMMLSKLFNGGIVKVEIGCGKVRGAGRMTAVAGIAFHEFFKCCGYVGAGSVIDVFFVLAGGPIIGRYGASGHAKHQCYDGDHRWNTFFHGLSLCVAVFELSG